MYAKKRRNRSRRERTENRAWPRPLRRRAGKSEECAARRWERAREKRARPRGQEARSLRRERLRSLPPQPLHSGYGACAGQCPIKGFLSNYAYDERGVSVSFRLV